MNKCIYIYTYIDREREREREKEKEGKREHHLQAYTGNVYGSTMREVQWANKVE